jgi:hypothetical protein
VNFSDSKKGKADFDWIIKIFFSAMCKHTAYNSWWNSLDLAAQKMVIDDIRDELRFRL